MTLASLLFWSSDHAWTSLVSWFCWARLLWLTEILDYIFSRKLYFLVFLAWRIRFYSGILLILGLFIFLQLLQKRFRCAAVHRCLSGFSWWLAVLELKALVLDFIIWFTFCDILCAVDLLKLLLERSVFHQLVTSQWSQYAVHSRCLFRQEVWNALVVVLWFLLATRNNR